MILDATLIIKSCVPAFDYAAGGVCAMLRFCACICSAAPLVDVGTLLIEN